MAQGKYTRTEYDSGVYGTGPTQPPKDNGSAIALLFMLVIFLLGIVTVLGVLNIQLFRELQKKETELAMSFSAVATETTETQAISRPDIQEAFGILKPPETPSDPTEEGMSLQDIYEQNIPSVVSVTAHRADGTGTGTGVIFDEAGYIVTNAHVVEGSKSIQLQLTDDRILEAKVLGSDEVTDLAVLKVEAEGLVEAQFGDSTALRVGDTVVAIGDPLGVEFRGTYTNGIVSAINRDVKVGSFQMTLIQTNAALNSGNSGGPLINCYGQVVGINTMKISQSTDASGVEGLGFAIPSVTVQEVVRQLMTQGYVSGRPTLGLEGQTLEKFDQRYLHLPEGLYITEVDRRSDAFAKGLQARDVLLSVDGQPVATMADLKGLLQNYNVGDTVPVVIYRGGQQHRVEVTLSEDRG